jgi:hypothetical protein
MKVAFDQISDFAQFVSADYSNNSSCQPQDQRLIADLRTKFIAGLQAHLSTAVLVLQGGPGQAQEIYSCTSTALNTGVKYSRKLYSCQM